jgi:hypothetical protein
MSELDLLAKIEAILKPGSSATARQIAQTVKVKTSDVNSILYRNKGLKFIVNTAVPPVWRSVEPFTERAPKTPELLAKAVNGSVEVSIFGEVWQVHIQVVNSSRNDPAFIVESLGARERIITVSVHVLSDEHQLAKLKSDEIPDAAIAMASAAIAYEAILQTGFAQTDEALFAKTCSDVLLQFSAAARKSFE